MVSEFPNLLDYYSQPSRLYQKWIRKKGSVHHSPMWKFLIMTSDHSFRTLFHNRTTSQETPQPASTHHAMVDVPIICDTCVSCNPRRSSPYQRNQPCDRSHATVLITMWQLVSVPTFFRVTVQATYCLPASAQYPLGPIKRPICWRQATWRKSLMNL